MTYDLFYTDMFCQDFTDLEKAIKMAKQTVKDNPSCKGGYTIRLDGLVIWKY